MERSVPLSSAWNIGRRKFGAFDDSIIFRLAGPGRGGVPTAGDLLERAAAATGLQVFSETTLPTEIWGGVVAVQLRVSTCPLPSKGDRFDVLVAFNERAFSAHRNELVQGRVLIYDDSLGEFDLSTLPEAVTYGVPMARLARVVGNPAAQNMVALGAISRLFGVPRRNLEVLVRERFAPKGDAVMVSNLKALAEGARYVGERLHKRDPYVISSAGATRGETLLLRGDEAIGAGALIAGCRVYAHYPFTSSCRLEKWLARHLPLVGGEVIQAEDEMASLGIAIGASYAGKKAMTAASGPGLDRMQEFIGYAAMTEIPVVIVDVQRAGPSAGLPTKHEQGDLLSAVYGAHGDVPKIVLAPADVQDCLLLTVEAFNLAERYQTPVILLADTSLVLRVETIPRPDLSQIRVIDRGVFRRSETPYVRYLSDHERGCVMAVPGQRGGEYVATGLEHDEAGRPSDDPTVHEKMTNQRFKKLCCVESAFLPIERDGPPRADVGIVSWGTTQGAVREAVQRFHAIGMPVAALYPKVLWPLPVDALEAFARSVNQVVVVEANRQGQLAELIAASTSIKPKRINVYRGLPITVWDIFGRESLVGGG